MFHMIDSERAHPFGRKAHTKGTVYIYTYICGVGWRRIGSDLFYKD